MNDDIKQGAIQLAKGLKTEAMKLTKEAIDTIEKVKADIDQNNDGKIDMTEVKLFGETALSEAKKSLDKIAIQLKDENVSNETKEKLVALFDDFKAKTEPIVEKTKKELLKATEEIKEKVETVEDVAEEVKDEAEEIVEE